MNIQFTPAETTNGDEGWFHCNENLFLYYSVMGADTEKHLVIEVGVSYDGILPKKIYKFDKPVRTDIKYTLTPILI